MGSPGPDHEYYRKLLGPKDMPVEQDVSVPVTVVKKSSGHSLTCVILLIALISGLTWMIGMLSSRGGQEGQHLPDPVRIDDVLKVVAKIDTDNRRYGGQCWSVSDEYKFDCHPSPRDQDRDSCMARGCCWRPRDSAAAGTAAETSSRNSTHNTPEPLGVPTCFYPNGFRSYDLVNISRRKDSFSAFYSLVQKSGYPEDVQLVRMDVEPLEDNTLRIKISDANQKRFEVPFYPPPSPSDLDLELDNLNYTVRLSDATFGFQVVRKSGQIIFDTMNVGGFVFANQLLQISTLLPSHDIYGLGETNSGFRKNTRAWTQYSMWNQDSPPPNKTQNLYGTHPFYMAMEEDGSSHGVFLKNSNAMETILQPTPALTFRTLGGVLDLYFFLGPEPTSVVEQYTGVIGRPFLPPFWSLGYHQCRFGYGSLQETKRIMKQTMDAGIPMDTQWNDIDYMDHRNDFTVDKHNFAGLKEFVDELHETGMHYVMIMDPGVSASEKPGTYPPFDLGLDMDIFIKNDTNEPFIGKVWNAKSTAFPDFFHPNATYYWTKLLQEFRKEVPHDGLWIDMNEPSNFADGQLDVGCPVDDDDDDDDDDDGRAGRLNRPPYYPRFLLRPHLYSSTVCPSARHFLGRHYDLHNLYGMAETAVTNRAMSAVRERKRPFVISRSTFAGQGHYGGHWTGDIHSDWHAMAKSVDDLLNFNIFGVPMIGADICGFTGNTTASLCERWVQLGAFYPFSRNHNDLHQIAQDPVSLGPGVTTSAYKALRARYTLLPYLYTLFVRAHLQGTPVVRAMFFEFPEDRRTYDLAPWQFLWGAGLMIVPVLLDDTLEVDPYLPGNTKWYNFYDVASSSTWIDVGPVGSYFKLEAHWDTIPLLVRGGTILVQKPSATTTVKSRKLPFILNVYLSGQGQADGELFWDDGDSIGTYDHFADDVKDGGSPEETKKKEFNHLTFHFEMDSSSSVASGQLTSDIGHHGHDDEPMALSAVNVFGLDLPSVTTVNLNGQELDTFFYHKEAKAISISIEKFDMMSPMMLKLN